MRNQVRLLLGDAIETTKTLPSDSVHCVVTSPPYWGLRDYGVDGQIGLEETFDEWLDKMVVLFEEIKRVLHPSGTLWVNMGDSYNSNRTRGMYGDQKRVDGTCGGGYSDHGYVRPTMKMHSKNLIGQPWRLAFALQESGWILRSDIVWHKPTVMPESVTDRPVRSHEFIHLFSSGGKYFFDMDAVRLKGKDIAPERYAAAKSTTWASGGLKKHAGANKTQPSLTHPSGAALRDVWSIPSEPFSEAHFATFPSTLPRLCILAGTSEKGCCPSCLAPWVRTFATEKQKLDNGKRKRADAPGAEVSESSVFRTGEINVRTPIGWEPSCNCEPVGEPIPCTVLDPFSGAGTTGLVAARLQRSYIGIELNPEYLEMSRRRIADDQPLFNEVLVG